MRRGAPFSLSSSARSQPYMCEHLRSTLYTLRASAVASGWACTGDCISRDLPFYSTVTLPREIASRLNTRSERTVAPQRW